MQYGTWQETTPNHHSYAIDGQFIIQLKYGPNTAEYKLLHWTVDGPKVVQRRTLTNNNGLDDAKAQAQEIANNYINQTKRT